MKKNLFKIALSVTSFAFPLVAFGAGKTLRDLVVMAMDYFKLGITLIISLAVVTFVWNVYRYFFTEKEKKEAGMYVLYSTIGFFVILSLWGLVNIITNTLKLDNNQPAWPFGASGGTPPAQQAPFVQTGVGISPIGAGNNFIQPGAGTSNPSHPSNTNPAF